MYRSQFITFQYPGVSSSIIQATKRYLQDLLPIQMLPSALLSLTCSHNGTAILLDQPYNLRQILLNLLLNLLILILIMLLPPTPTILLLLIMRLLIRIMPSLLLPLLLIMLLLLLLLLLTTTLIRLPAIPRMIPSAMMTLQILRHNRLPTPQVHKDPPRILLRRIAQPQLPTHLLHPRFDLLHVAGAMVPLAHNHMEVGLPRGLRVPDALLDDILGLFDELAVQVDGVGDDAVERVVLAEDVVGGLVVVGVHHGAVALALFGEGVRGGAVAALVGLLGLKGGGEVMFSLVSLGAVGEGRGGGRVCCAPSPCRRSVCRLPAARGLGDGHTQLRHWMKTGG